MVPANNGFRSASKILLVFYCCEGGLVVLTALFAAACPSSLFEILDLLPRH